MTLAARVRAAEARLVAPGSASDLAWVRTVLAVTLAFRLLIEPYQRFADQPDPLFFGAFAVRWLGSMPPDGVIVVVQVVALVAAAACVAQIAPRWTFLAAWLGLLFLGGLRGSAGKILHNDVLLLLACVPMLFAPRSARRGSTATGVAYGWPRRGGLVVAAAVYCMTGLQKVRHSGIDWVMSRNQRWVLYNGAAEGKAPTDAIARYVADRAWLATAMGVAFLAFEVGAPLLALWSRWSRWAFLAGSIALHTGVWLALGLHYWGWVLTVAALVVPWGHLVRRSSAPPVPIAAVGRPGTAA